VEGTAVVHEADHLPPSTALVKKEWKHTPNHPTRLHDR